MRPLEIQRNTDILNVRHFFAPRWNRRNSPISAPGPTMKRQLRTCVSDDLIGSLTPITINWAHRPMRARGGLLRYPESNRRPTS